MTFTKSLGNVLFGIGALALVGTIAFVAISRQGPGSSGFEDLATFALALLAAAVAGLAFGGSLVLAWRARQALPTWRLAVAAVGCLVGLFAGGVLAWVAWESRNWSLIAFGALVVAAAVFGMAGGASVAQRRAAA